MQTSPTARPAAETAGPNSEGPKDESRVGGTVSSSDGGSDDWRPAAPEEHDGLLYDPDADDADEQALHSARNGRHSDALLSCPCCFTTVCVDCQQHATDSALFRAMFVQHCRLLEGEHGVRVLCDVCEADLGRYDASVEVYEFDSVLATEA